MQRQDVLQEQLVDVLYGLHLLLLRSEAPAQQELYPAGQLVLRERHIGTQWERGRERERDIGTQWERERERERERSNFPANVQPGLTPFPP